MQFGWQDFIHIKYIFKHYKNKFKKICAIRLLFKTKADSIKYKGDSEMMGRNGEVSEPVLFTFIKT